MDTLQDAVATNDHSNQIATNFPGRFSITSACGNKYLVLVYNIDPNWIHAVPIKFLKTKELIWQFQTFYEALQHNNFLIKELQCDNEISRNIIGCITSQAPDYQLVDTYNHLSNPAEWAIQSFKCHFISILTGCDPHYPKDAWDTLIPYGNITLNLFWASSIQSKLSAYVQIHRNFYYNQFHLSPVRCKVIAYNKN